MQKNNPTDKTPMSKGQNSCPNPSAQNKANNASKKDQAQSKKPSPEQF